MPARSGSSSIETTRPSSVTCPYQLSSPRTVSATAGFCRMYRRRRRLSSMLRSTRPSSQSYQVAAVWGAPLGLTVATTAGLGRARNASTSGGTGTGGTRPSLLSGDGQGVGAVIEPDLAHRAEPDDEQRARDDPGGRDDEVRL